MVASLPNPLSLHLSTSLGLLHDIRLSQWQPRCLTHGLGQSGLWGVVGPGPGLEILQGAEGPVPGAWLRGWALAHVAFAEGLRLEGQHQSVGGLALCFPFLGRLSPVRKKLGVFKE